MTLDIQADPPAAEVQIHRCHYDAPAAHDPAALPQAS